MKRLILGIILLIVFGIDYEYYEELHTYTYPDHKLDIDPQPNFDSPLIRVYYPDDGLTDYRSILTDFKIDLYDFDR